MISSTSFSSASSSPEILGADVSRPRSAHEIAWEKMTLEAAAKDWCDEDLEYSSPLSAIANMVFTPSLPISTTTTPTSTPELSPSASKDTLDVSEDEYTPPSLIPTPWNAKLSWEPRVRPTKVSNGSKAKTRFFEMFDDEETPQQIRLTDQRLSTAESRQAVRELQKTATKDEILVRYPLLVDTKPQIPEIWVIHSQPADYSYADGCEAQGKPVIPWEMPIVDNDVRGVSFNEDFNWYERYGVLFDPAADNHIPDSEILEAYEHINLLEDATFIVMPRSSLIPSNPPSKNASNASKHKSSPSSGSSSSSNSSTIKPNDGHPYISPPIALGCFAHRRSGTEGMLFGAVQGMNAKREKGLSFKKLKSLMKNDRDRGTKRDEQKKRKWYTSVFSEVTSLFKTSTRGPKRS